MDITLENVQKIIETSEKLVVLDFGAEWCGPCKTMDKVIKEIKDDFSDKVEFIGIDVAEHNDIAVNYAIASGIPKFLFFKKGSQVNVFAGSKSKEDFVKFLNSML